jgi:glycosyltransferase involved in cell wall biosynthesis
MFLSLIIPVYNAEKYVAETLDSLLNQDLPSEEYEIICINDGSRDGSLAVLQSYAEKHPNIRIIDKENGGVTTARNAGLEAAQGDFIWFFDADDLAKENILQKLKAVIPETGCDRIVFGAYEFTDTMTETEWEQSRNNQLTTNTSWYDAVVWRSLLRRDFLRQHDLYFRYPELTHGEDGLFMYEVTLCDPEPVETEEVIYFYRLHSGSAEAVVSPESHRRRLRSLIRVCKILRDYYQRGAKDSANRFMSFLWMTLYDMTRAPSSVAAESLQQMKDASLFPFHRPADCTIRESYLTGGGLVGKVFDALYLNLHRPWAFHAMKLLQKLRK